MFDWAVICCLLECLFLAASAAVIGSLCDHSFSQQHVPSNASIRHVPVAHHTTTWGEFADTAATVQGICGASFVSRSASCVY